MNQQTTINLREERDFGQKINATFLFLGQNFKQIFSAVLLISGPFFIFGGILMGAFQSEVMGFGGGAEPATTWGQYTFANQIRSGYYLGALLMMLVGGTLMALSIYGYMVEYMDNGNRKPTVSQVWENVKEHMMACILSVIGATVMIMAGFLLLAIPGMYMAVMFSLLLIVMVREDLNFIEAVGRCYSLIKGNWWATFGLLIVAAMIQGFASLIFQVPTYAIIFAKAAGVAFVDNKLTMILVTLLSTLGGSLLYVFSFTAAAFQYFNLVEKREGTGYLEQVGQIGKVRTTAEEHAY